MSKKITSFVLAVFLLCAMCIPSTAYASDIQNSIIPDNSAQLSSGINAKTMADIRDLVTATFSDQPGTYTIGRSLPAYSADSGNYFCFLPVFQGETCVALIHMDKAGNMVLSDNTTIYDAAVNLPENSYVLYIAKGVVYAESNELITVLEKTGYYTTSESNDYISLPYTEKVDGFLANGETTIDVHTLSSSQEPYTEISVDARHTESDALPDVVVPYIESGDCGITNYVTQGNYGLCWAASVATIVNYKRGYSLTAISIAQAYGDDYTSPSYAGRNIYEVAQIISNYGLSYVAGNRISWVAVKNAINSRYPFAISIASYDSSGKLIGHALVGYGYECAYGDGESDADSRYVYAWDPNGSHISFKYYNYSNIFLYGSSWEWTHTAYATAEVSA